MVLQKSSKAVPILEVQNWSKIADGAEWVGAKVLEGSANFGGPKLVKKSRGSRVFFGCFGVSPGVQKKPKMNLVLEGSANFGCHRWPSISHVFYESSKAVPILWVHLLWTAKRRFSESSKAVPLFFGVFGGPFLDENPANC